MIHDPISDVALMLRYGEKDYPYNNSIILNYLTIDGYLMQMLFDNKAFVTTQLDESNIPTDGLLKYFRPYIITTNKVFYLNIDSGIEKVLNLDFEIIDAIRVASDSPLYMLSTGLLVLLDSTGLIHVIDNGKYIRSETLMHKQLNDHYQTKWCKIFSAPRKNCFIIMNTLGHCYMVSNNFFIAPLDMYTEVYSQCTSMIKNARSVDK